MHYIIKHFQTKACDTIISIDAQHYRHGHMIDSHYSSIMEAHNELTGNEDSIMHTLNLVTATQVLLVAFGGAVVSGRDPEKQVTIKTLTKFTKQNLIYPMN